MNKIKTLAVVGALVFSVIGLTGCASSTLTNVGPCHVNDKTATSKSSGKIKYLVYTDECGVLTIDDAPLLGAFNSSDTYNSVKKDGTYSFSTYGFRNGLMSSYPNIIKLKAVKQ